MKYKVGDKVRIKSIKIFHEDDSSYGFTPGMSKLCGKIATITDVHLGFYYIDIDKNNYCWTDEMLEETNKNNKMETKKVKITLPKNCEVEKVETSVEGGFLIVEYTPKYEPKVGDIVFATAGIGSNPQQFIFIYGISTVSLCKGEGLSPRNEWKYKGTPIDWTYSHIRLATDEEKKLLFSEMEKHGLRWNEKEKKVEKIEIFSPKVGDILSDGSITLIYRGTNETAILTECCYGNNLGIVMNESPCRGCGYTHTYHMATDEEKETFLSKIKEEGYTLNQETKKLEKIRWRAKNGEDYFIVSGELIIEKFSEENDDIDDNFYFSHNYFKTKKEAMDARDKIKELLKNR